MTAFWFSIFFLALAKNAVSEYKPEICSILEENMGLIPPPLPRSFEMKAEHVDHNKKYASYEEIYFDYAQSRAKYKYLLDTFEFNYLFDYKTQQIVEWIKVHPGISMKRDPLSHHCEAVDMDESEYRHLFGFQDAIYLQPKMFNSYEVLRYGGRYLYAYNGSEKLDERNLEVNKFRGCIYDDSTKTTMLNDYYFADTNKVLPSGGTPSTIVTGSSEKPLSVPVKIRLTGGYPAGNDLARFNKTISISWFKGDPKFKDETFQIPPWIYCENYRGRLEKPTIATAFSTRVTITHFMVDMLGELNPETSGESYEEIYYDQGRNLARRDFTPNPHIDTDIYSKFGNYMPVSTIYDFNEGLRFTINKVSGRCYIGPIMDNEYFDTEQQSLYRKLASPEEIFLMQMDDMEYKGKAFARDIQCDVWNGKHYHETYKATFVKETYFSTAGWHVNEDGVVERSVPVKHVLIKKELDGEALEGISTYNFLKFDKRQPKLSSFDIQNCVELIDHKRFAIELMLNDEISNLVSKYKFFFLEAAQLYLANKTEVHTPLRIQRLHLRHLTARRERTFLIFSLLRKADLSNLPIVVGQKGKELEEAVIVLQRLIDDGKFIIQFPDPQTKEIIAVSAGRRSLYSLTDEGILTPAPLRPAKIREFGEQNVEPVISYNIKEGMTSGHLTLLAFAMLFIGVGIGIAIMYLYLRVYAERQVEDKIKLSETACIVTPESAAAENFQETP